MKSRFVNHWPILLLFVLAFLFMGKTLFPRSGFILGGYDIHGIYSPLIGNLHNALWNGRLPLWNSYLSNGYPLFIEPQMELFYPPAYLSVLLPINIGLSWYMLFHMSVVASGTYFFSQQMGASKTASLLAACTFTFSGYLGARLWAGHAQLYAVNSWLPWMLWGLAIAVQRQTKASAVLAGVPFALAILAGHVPSVVYLGLIWGLFALYLQVNGGKSVLRQASITLIMALALSAIQLAPFLQFVLQSERVASADLAFATQFSFPPAHLITFFVPEFFGEPLRTGYWSVPVFEELLYYAGILPWLCLWLSLRRPTRLTLFYWFLIVLGLLIGFGSYGFLYPILYQWIPVFSLLRAPGRALMLTLFGLTGLVGETITHWDEVREPQALAHMLRMGLTAVATAGTAALAATGAVFIAIHPTDTSGRLWHQIGGWSVALLVFLAGGALLWPYLQTPPANIRQRRLLAGGLLFLVVSDLWLVSFKMVRLESTAPNPFWVSAKAIIGDTPARVLPWGVPIFWQNDAELVGLHSVFLYLPLELSSVATLTSSVPDPRSSAYDVMGVEYVVAPVPLDDFTEGERPLTLIGQQDNTWVYRRGRVLPVVRQVGQVEVIADAGQAIARLHEPAFDPLTTAVVATPPDCTPAQPTTPPQTTLLAQENGFWRIATQSDTATLLIVSETAYPGWQVTVDGAPAESLTAFTALRAVCVPAGAHEVVWQFRPTIHWLGLLFTLPALLATGLAGRATFIQQRRNL